MVPTVELPEVTPFTCQVTDVVLPFLTVAVNFWVAPAVNDVVEGEMLMVTGSSVTWAEADLEVSALEIALMVTTVCAGTDEGTT